jgi:hypothetical protein
LSCVSYIVTQLCTDGKENRKEKGAAIARNSFISLALQDGLGFKKMKSIEILRNHKKLKNN